MKLDFYQIIYDESQRKACYPFAQVYFNESLTIFFENSVLVVLVSDSQADKISVCSWRRKEKVRWNVIKTRELTQELLESDYEVLSFTNNSPHHRMLDAAGKWHPGFRSTLQKIMDAIGKKCPHEVKNPIYQNAFSAPRETYMDYIKEYLSPAMYVMKNDPEINKLIMQDSNYSKLDKSSPEKLKALKEKIGIDYYPMAPFILERLFSVYCTNNKINVTWL